MWLCLGSVTISLALRVLYLMHPWRIDVSEPRAFLAAEGLMGLMARHIVTGARPLFFYGQYYLGTFEAYVAAAVFAVFGSSMTTLRVVPTAFALSWIPLTGVIAGKLYGRRAGWLAAALIALPSPFAFEWGFTAWGGHANVPMVLVALLLCVWLVQRFNRACLAALGFVVGFSLWVNQLAVVYVPMYAYALVRWIKLRRSQMALVLIAAVIGLLPLLYGNVVHPLATVRNLASRVQSSYRLSSRLSKQPLEEHKFYRSVPLFQVLGAQPRRDGAWSVGGTLGALFLVVGGLGGAWRAYQRRAQAPLIYRGSMLVLACAAMSVLVGISGFFGQPVGRYNLPLYPLLCVLTAGWLESLPQVAVPLVGAFVLGHAVQIAIPFTADARTPSRDVIAALTEHGLRYGYGADNMYDLTFESGEQIIIEPVEWTRYTAYQSAVAHADRIFYLYRDDQRLKISYRVFMAYLENAGIQYGQFDVGEYHVLYNFEPRAALSGEAIQKVRDEIRRRKGRRPQQNAGR
jgi:4-amino-4-deoxy-L-arabinose transferase-like glycosyltransferase